MPSCLRALPIALLWAVGCVESDLPGEGGTSPSTGPHDTTWGPHTDPITTPPVTDPDPMMYGFSYVRPGIAGMPLPNSETEQEFLAFEGVDFVITLTEEPPDVGLVELGVATLHLPIEDFQPPTLEQQHELVLAIRASQQASEVVAVHCLAGLGRTGTMLATWLVAEGLDAEAAMAEVRALRPGSIETEAQEDAVRRYARAMEMR